MDTWRYLPYSTNNAAVNMAIDEGILQARLSELVPNTLRFYRWHPSAVSIGRNQNPYSEVYLETAKQFGIDVVRRISGGGAVYHDFEGEVTYSLVAKLSDLGLSNIAGVYLKIYAAIADGLRILGVSADFNSGNDKNCPNLTVNGKKISGSSQVIKRGVVLQHGTILVRADLLNMFQLIKLKDLSCTLAADIGKRKITSIQTELGHNISLNTVVNALLQGFKAMLRIQLREDQLSSSEKLSIDKLKEKYFAEAWNLRGKTT